jgi:hypothetical protein
MIFCMLLHRLSLGKNENNHGSGFGFEVFRPHMFGVSPPMFLSNVEVFRLPTFRFNREIYVEGHPILQHPTFGFGLNL